MTFDRMTLLAGTPETRVTKVMTALPAGFRVSDLVHETGLTSGRVYKELFWLQRAGRVTATWEETGRRRYTLTAGGLAEPSSGADRSRREPQSWLVVVALAAITSSIALSHSLSDLRVYMGAVTGLRHASSLYDFVSLDNAPFTYPPFAGLMFWPLTFVPTSLLEVVWTLATVATVISLAVLLARRTDVSAVALAAVLLLSAPVASDLKYGQVSIYLAGLVVLDVTVLSASRWQGVLVGVAAAVKLTPLVFIPMLWLAGRHRAAVVAASAFGICGAAAFALLPADSWRFWSSAMWHVDRLGAITSAGNQSLDGAMLRIGVPDPGRSAIMLVAGAAVAVVALRRAAKLARGGDWLSATIVVGAASVAISPVSWTHHQLWLVLAALLPVRCSHRIWAIAILAVMILPVTTFALMLPWPIGLIARNARGLTAIVVACAVPLEVTQKRVPAEGRNLAGAPRL